MLHYALEAEDCELEIRIQSVSIILILIRFVQII